MKKIVSALLLVFVLLLSSCFGGDDQKDASTVGDSSGNGEIATSDVDGTTEIPSADGEIPSADGEASIGDATPADSSSEEPLPVGPVDNEGFAPDVFVEDAGPDPELTENQFYDLEIDDTLKIDRDTVINIGIFANDIASVNGNADDEETFKIWRDFLFGESNLDESAAFMKCLDSGNTVGLSGTYKDVCEGKDEYIADKNTNYAKIKNLFTIAKEANKSKSDNKCANLLTSEYKWQGLPAEKINDYLFCKKIANGDTFDIKQNYFYFYKAVEIEKCEFLKDEKLINLCNDVKADFPDLTQ